MPQETEAAVMQGDVQRPEPSGEPQKWLLQSTKHPREADMRRCSQGRVNELEEAVASLEHRVEEAEGSSAAAQANAESVTSDCRKQLWEIRAEHSERTSKGEAAHKAEVRSDPDSHFGNVGVTCAALFVGFASAGPTCQPGIVP